MPVSGRPPHQSEKEVVDGNATLILQKGQGLRMNQGKPAIGFVVLFEGTHSCGNRESKRTTHLLGVL